MAHRRLPKLALLSTALPAALAIVAFAPSALAADAAPEPLPTPAPLPIPAPPPVYADPVGTGVGQTTSGGASSEGASVDQIPEAHAHHHGMTPLAGYADGKFFLRDANDTFLLIPSARLQIDAFAYGGRGVADYQRTDGSGLKADMFLKRERIELGGRILKRWYFWVAGDFAGGGQGGSETVKSTASNAAADAFIGVELSKWLRLQVGQFDLPFTAENVTSDKWLTFMERSLTVRTLGAPYNKDLGFMARGESPKGHFSYAVAAVGGDGQNRPSPDNRVDFAGRFLLRPFAGDDKSPVQRMHVGVSGRWGRRDPDYVRYDAPGFSTPGGYTFWSPSYGSGAAETHVMPSKDQLAGAAELFVPFQRFDLTGEFVYVNEDRREALKDTLGNTERAGTLKGYSYYVQASWWPFGEPRLPGEVGAYPDPKLNLPKEAKPSHPKRALQLSARFEQMRLQYDSTDRSDGVAGVKVGTLDAKTKDIKVDAVQLGATYWATKHVRLTAMWSGYHFPGTAGVDNQAGAPGTKSTAKLPDATWLHEFSARVALAL